METPQNEMEIYKKTLLYLENSYNSKDNEKVQEAGRELKILSNDFKTHFQVMLKILSSDEKEVKLDIKKAAAIYLKNITVSKSKQLSKEDIISLLQNVLNLVLNPTASNYKPNPTIDGTLNNLIFCLLNLDQFLSDKELPNQILTYLSSTMIKSQIEMYIPTAKSIFNILNTFIATKSVNKDTLQITIKHIMTCCDDVFSKVPLYIIPSKNQLDMDFLSLLRYLYEVLNALVKKIKSYIGHEQIVPVFFQKYGQYSFELITLSINNLTSDGNIIYYTQDSTMNGKVNAMKSKAFQFLTRIIEIYKEEITNQDLVQLSSKMVQLVINSIDYAIKNNKLSLLNQEINFKADSSIRDRIGKEEDDYNNFVFSMLAFLTRVLIREPFKTEFTPLMQSFLLNSLFPLIVPAKEDMSMIQIDGHDYYLFISDLIQEQEFKNYRAAACFLLKKLSTQYVDLYIFIISFCIQMLDILLTSKGDESKIREMLEKKEFYLFLEAKKRNASIFLFEPEYLIQFCMIILLLLSHHVDKNIQFKNSLKLLLQKHSDQLNQLNSILIKDKLCMIYEEFIPVLFDDGSNDNVEYVSKIFDFMFNLLLSSSSYPGLSYQAAQSLLYLIEDNATYITLMSQVINLKFSNLITLIDEAENDNLFEFISKIVSDVVINDYSVLMNALNRTVIRLKKEIIAGNTTYIEKTFQILIVFLKGVNSFKNVNTQEKLSNIETFQTMILPIISYIKNPKKIDFEDNILNLSKEFLVATQKISDVVLMIIQNLNLVCLKNDMLSDEVFSFLIEFIKYDTLTNGAGCLVQNFKIILQIIQMSIEEHFEDLYSVKYSLYLTIKLLSLNIQGMISKEDLKILLVNSIACIIPEEESNFDDSEYTNLLSIVAMGTSFIYYPEDTLEILETEKFTATFISYLQYYISQKRYYYTELFKCIILGMCSLLINKNTLSIFIQTEKISGFIRLFFRMLWRQKEEETKNLKELMKKEINCNFVEGEESDDDDLDEEERQIKEEQKILLDELSENKIEIKQCEISFAAVDEFQEFVNCLQNLEINNPTIVAQFKESLTPQEVVALKELVHVRNIKVTYNNTTLNVPRRTVRIKRAPKA